MDISLLRERAHSSLFISSLHPKLEHVRKRENTRCIIVLISHLTQFFLFIT